MEYINPIGRIMSVKNCIRYNGRLYCYSRAEGMVYVYPEYKYEINEIPKEVISRIILNDCDTKIIIGDGGD